MRHPVRDRLPALIRRRSWRPPARPLGALAVALIACAGGDQGAGPAVDAQDADAAASVDVAMPDAVFTDVPVPETAHLTDPHAWSVLEDAADPFADHRPDSVTCPGQAWGSEGLTFEVDTGLCDYLSVAQPALLPLEPSDAVDIVVGHFPLIARQPAEAHAAVLIDGVIAWEVTVPIPSETQVYEAAWSPTEPVPAGAEVVFHLHNHGSNNWFLATLARRGGSLE